MSDGTLPSPSAFVRNHPDALANYEKFAGAMEKVLEKHPGDAPYFRDFLHSYSQYCEYSTGALMQQQPANRAHMQMAAADGMRNFVQHYNQKIQGSPGAKQAWAHLQEEMSGPSFIDLYLFDSKRAEEKHSTLAGVQWGSIIGAVGGFAASRMFGLSGIMEWVAGGAMALGFAYGGRKIQEYLTRDGKEEDDAPRFSAAPNSRTQAAENGANPGVSGGQNVAAAPPPALPLAQNASATPSL